MKIIYLHGGPGLNSYPEQQLLSQSYALSGLDVDFWNETREFNSENLYTELRTDLIQFIKSYNSPVIVLAHSWGSRLLMDCLDSLEGHVHAACLVAPAIDFSDADRRICDFSLKILTAQASMPVDKIEKFLASNNKEFNQEREEALLQAFSSNYFTHNFINPANLQKYFSFLTGDNEFRITDMLKIRRTMPLSPTQIKIKSSFKTTVIFGKKDPIFNIDSEGKYLTEQFSDLDMKILDGESHYAHIESPEVIISELKRLLPKS